MTRDDYRIRVGDYRIVYAVDDALRLVVIARIAHRREAYRR
jgi:mRNA interferase RelE/StbE